LQRYINEGYKDRRTRRKVDILPSCVLVADISTAFGQDFPQCSRNETQVSPANYNQEAHRDNYLDFIES